MSALGKLTNAPASLELDGKAYQLSWPSIAAFGDFQEWIQAAPLRKAGRKIKAAGADLPDSIRDKIWEKAYADSEAIEKRLAETGALNLADVNATLAGAAGSTETVIKFAHLCLQAKHPDLTVDDVAGLITAENIEQVSDALNAFLGLTETDLKNSVSPNQGGNGKTDE